MKLHGNIAIGGTWVGGKGPAFSVISPLDQDVLDPVFRQASADQAVEAASLAEQASPVYAKHTPEERALFLETISAKIEALGEDLLVRANRETGLPLARLTGERARTCGQLRLFAQVVREGSWVDARIDTALPDRKPLPRPDLRRMLIPLGPVVIFGSSNFPLAFSVAGGDTASALAAGNPVIVKSHSAHPGTSEMVTSAVLAAVAECGMPEGVFSMLHGSGRVIGLELVRQPAVRAVGFTGSHTAGRALFDAAASRPDPIPVFAEMASLNPVFVLPGLLETSGKTFANGLRDSVTLGVGQFCTKPGLVFGIGGPAWESMIDEFGHLISEAPPATMLNRDILDAFESTRDGICARTGIGVFAKSRGVAETSRTEAAPVAAIISGDQFLTDLSCGETEVFGPFCLFVKVRDVAQLIEIASGLKGQLTTSIHHAEGADDSLLRELIPLAVRKAGRVVLNGFPTGVEVCPSMNHGGPYPATTDTRFTSVGTAAMLRFARPVCMQNCPEALLPKELQSDNPREIMRLVNGQHGRDGVVR